MRSVISTSVTYTPAELEAIEKFIVSLPCSLLLINQSTSTRISLYSPRIHVADRVSCLLGEMSS